MRLLIVGMLAFASNAEAGTIYLCRTQSDGWFWSSAPCSTHNAYLDRTVSVPDGLPWDQKVALGEQARRNAAALVAPNPSPQGPSQQQALPPSECAALRARASQLDAMAMQPQSGATQDWIAKEKRAVRDRQFRLRC